MTSAITKWLQAHNVSNRLSPHIEDRVRIITFIALFPLFIHTTLTLFSWYQQNYLICIFCIINTVVSVAVIVLARLQKVLTAKTVLMCINCFAVFVYMNQFEMGYNIFCYIFPLIFGIVVLFDFKQELAAFYVVLVFVVTCGIIAALLPANLLGQVIMPLHIKQFFGWFNIIISAIIVISFLFLLIKITVDTELKLSKALESAAEANAAKAAFLRNMSHELRTPLNGINGTTHILLNETFLPTQQANLDTLKNLSEHMTLLVNDILDFSKIEAGKLTLHAHRFNMGELLDKLTTSFATVFAEKKLSLVIDLDERLWQFDLYSDELRLQQVLYNLLSNAAKFTEKGRVTLTASIIQKNTTNVNLFIGVTDTGIGIAPEQLDRIFKSFQQGDAATTRKYGGTGLGLSISSSLVQLFGGKLHVQSTLGKGSIFFMQICMPCCNDAIETVPKAKALSPTHLRHLKVLLAEDNPINMVVATKALQRLEVQLTTAENGKIAVEKFASQPFDVVLLDLEMPEMDGRVALTEIRRQNQQVPVIAFTAAFYENMQEELFKIGFTDYVLKPFKPEDLYQKMAQVVQAV